MMFCGNDATAKGTVFGLIEGPDSALSRPEWQD